MNLKDFFGKYWPLITGCAGILGTCFVWVFDAGSHFSDSRHLMFDSVEQKVGVVTYVETSPTPEQKQRKLILDSINIAEEIISRRKRDSIMFRQDSLRRVTDSINRLNADQLFQIKQELKELKLQRSN